MIDIERPREVLFAGERRTATIGYFFAFILLGLAAAFIGPIIPIFAERLDVSIAGLSYLFPARSMGYMVGVLVSGRAYDRVSGHPMLALMVVLMTVSLALFPLAGSLYLLIVVALFLGVAESFIDIGGNTLLPWQYEANVSPFLNGLHFCFGVGSFLAPLIIGVLLNSGMSLNWFFWGIGVFSLPTAFLIWRSKSPSIRKVANPSGAARFPWTLVIFLTIMFFLYVGGEMGYGGWISTYAISLNLGDPAKAAYLTSAYWGSLTLGRLLSIPLAAKTRPTNILVGSLLASLASMAIFFLFPIEPLVTWLATIGLGLSMSAVFPTIIAFAEVNHKITGQMNSVFFIGVSLGGMVLPWGMGQIFENAGLNWGMLMVALSMGTALLVFLLLQQIQKRKSV